MPHQGEMLQTTLANTAPFVGVVPTGSPFTYEAPSEGALFISGGTVSLAEIGRMGLFIGVGLLSGNVPVSTGDSVRVTYVLAPTLTFCAR